MSGVTSIVWFRQDLRLADNPALMAGIGAGAGARKAVPVFIWPDEDEIGAASEWWLHCSLQRLDEELRQRGSRLTILRGQAAEALVSLAERVGARSVYWNRLYEPAIVNRDTRVEKALNARGIMVETFPGYLLFEPGTVLNGTGEPYRVFTAFWNACLRSPAPAVPLAAPEWIPGPDEWPESFPPDTTPGSGETGFGERWTPGEPGALSHLKHFEETGLGGYLRERDRPDHRGTSRLSPHLHFGEVSARQVWHSCGDTGFRRQLVWREFAHQLLFHFPATATAPLRPAFARFPWRRDETGLIAWTRGKTGYPIVDAGMRELLHTGWMHNRVRMVAASFLVKHLLISWREGAAWFWDTLVDADLANNTLGWQWVAGCGADAAPYFRIFNPVLQGEKFDPDGAYVRRWVPELAEMPSAWIHRPWEAPAMVLQGAGVILGKTYPAPLVDHQAARERALAALATLNPR